MSAPGPVCPPLLYVITDRHATGGVPLPTVVERTLAGLGAEARRVAVQLREKDLSARALLELALALRSLTAAAGAALYINDRVDVALAAGANGVHLGGPSLAVADARAVAPGLRIGVSTHSVTEVEAAARAGADFAVFGPVFETLSKPGKPALGVGELRLACAVGLPVLALGGLDPETARACQRVGATGVACIRAVMGATNPAHMARMFLSRFN